LGDEPEGGFLKLKETQGWLLGEASAPVNKKPTNKVLFDHISYACSKGSLPSTLVGFLTV